jgi:hypothetical protein
MDQFEGLANAIIIQAAADYRLALKQLRQNPLFQPAIRMSYEVERFFRSDWFSILTRINGIELLARLKTEVEI